MQIGFVLVAVALVGLLLISVALIQDIWRN